jgi:hypothetical protein
VQLRRDRFRLQRQDGLQHPGQPGGALQVADAGLHRADHQRSVGGPVPPVDGRQRRHLDRIAERGAGAVRLDVVHRGRLDQRRFECLADHRLLRRSVGDGDAAGAAVLVDRGAGDHGLHAVAGVDGVLQALEHEHDAAFAPHVAVRRRVEGLAAPVRGEHPGPGEVDAVLRSEDDVHPGGQRDVALPLAQALAGQVQGDQRRRASGVHRQARPPQIQQVGDAPRGHAPRSARGHVGVDLGRVARHEPVGEVVAADASEDARGASVQVLEPDPGALQGLPAHLEEQALLRVEADRLARRDAEERRIEGVQPVEEGAESGDDLARRGGIGMVIGVRVPAFGGHVADRVGSADEEVPEGLRRVRPPGDAAAGPDDGDRLPVLALGGLQLGPELRETV